MSTPLFKLGLVGCSDCWCHCHCVSEGSGYFCVCIAGVPHDDPAALDLAKAISESPGVELTGVYAHCGNSYDCTGLEEIHAVAQATTTATLRFMDK